MDLRFRAALTAVTMMGLNANAFAQPTDPLAATRQDLTGGSARQWVLKRVVSILGPGDQCKEGEALRFLASGVVEREICLPTKHLDTQSLSWTLEVGQSIDPIVTFGGISYELYFYGSPTDRHMRLREPGADKLHEAIDQDYYLSPD